MKTVFLKKLSKKQINSLIKRPSIDFERILPKIKKILEDVKKQGDKAVRKYTKKFDGLDLEKFQVSSAEFKTADTVEPKVKKALQIAAKNIEKFHKIQLKKEEVVETMPGVKCWREARPIERVGLYIPKGLVSTVLMLGIPARIAGCQEIIMCTPQSFADVAPLQACRGATSAKTTSAKTAKTSLQGKGIQKEMLLAAKIVGITKIFKIGGAQAIAAMAYGTDSAPKVDKIFGPGSQYVTAAKMLVSIDSEGAAIDLPAGPSEVLVIADETANPAFAAADLLSQAEHGPDSQVVLISASPDLVKKINKELKRQLLDLPEKRRAPASKTLQNSFCLISQDIDKAIGFANLYAPEHLILNLRNPEKYIEKIKNAGSVFVGEYSPESSGDYASGANHALPTSGWAKSCSGVSVDSFVKKITFQKLSKAGFKNIAKTVEILADVEQMPAHKKAVALRRLT